MPFSMYQLLKGFNVVDMSQWLVNSGCEGSALLDLLPVRAAEREPGS